VRCRSSLCQTFLASSSLYPTGQTFSLDIAYTTNIPQQIPSQDALLYGNCPTTDFGCVCADADKVATFLKLLRISCSAPTGSEKAYQSNIFFSLLLFLLRKLSSLV
jgi:hypothetical protein